MNDDNLVKSFTQKLISKVTYKLRTFFLPGKKVVKNIHGINYRLDLSENIDTSLYINGFWEKNTTQFLHHIITPAMTVFEVGANVGAHTFFMAKYLKQGKLYSFEPTDYAFEKLSANAALNAFDNVMLNQIALSDTTEEKEIQRASSQETMPFKASWDIKRKGPKYSSKDLIKFTTLDAYFESMDLKQLDLIKIDTDGYELRVIRGARKTISKYKPKILIEIGYTVERIGDSFDELISTLQELGYGFHSIDDGRRFDHASLIKEVKEKRTIDCLCLAE